MLKNRSENLVLIFYGITMMAMLSFMYYTFPSLNYIRYSYVALMIVLMFMRKKIYRNIRINSIVFLFLIHTVLFGYVIIPATVSNSVVHENSKEFLIFWFFVFTTVQYITNKNIEKKFLLISQFCISLFVNYCYIKNFNGLAPLRYIGSIFNVGNRVRFSFGLSAPNQMAYLSVASIIMILIVLKTLPQKRKNIYTLYLYLSLIIDILVILSTQTRGAIFSIVLYMIFDRMLYSQKLNKNIQRGRIKQIWIPIVVIAGIFSFLYLFYVLEASSRSYLLSLSLEAYKKLANPLFGLGYVNYWAFLNDAFYWGTSALDCYYVYIICTTGIIGALLALGPLIYMAIYYIKAYFSGYVDEMSRKYIIVYFVTLYIGFSETTVVGPWLPYNYVFWVLFLLSFVKIEKCKSLMRKEKLIKLSRVHG